MKRKVAKVAVVLMRPGAVIGRVLRRFRTVRSAEKFVAAKEKTDSVGLARGDYGINAPEKRAAERRKSYVHGGEKKMREATNRRRRV